MSNLPANQTTLPLLAQLLNTALRGQQDGKRMRLEAVRLLPQSIELELGLRGVAGPLDGSYLLQLEVKESTPQHTVCEPSWQQAGGLGKLVGLGARLLPRGLLNQALERMLGGWLQVQGEQIVIDHAGLMAALAERSGNRGG